MTMNTKRKTTAIYGAIIDPAYSVQRPLFALTKQVWHPATDVYEAHDRAIIRMELAGIAQETLKITADGRKLRVAGRRSEPKSSDILCYHLSEIQYGQFERIFEFPFPIKIDEITAAYEQGFLIVEVPKKADQKTVVSIAVISDPEKSR